MENRLGHNLGVRLAWVKMITKFTRELNWNYFTPLMASSTRSWRNAYMQTLLMLRTGNGNSMKNTQSSKPTQET